MGEREKVEKGDGQSVSESNSEIDEKRKRGL